LLSYISSELRRNLKAKFDIDIYVFIRFSWGRGTWLPPYRSSTNCDNQLAILVSTNISLNSCKNDEVCWIIILVQRSYLDDSFSEWESWSRWRNLTTRLWLSSLGTITFKSVETPQTLWDIVICVCQQGNVLWKLRG